MEFNSLPLDVHLAIFSYLSVREVMRIREVCKQWNRQINDEFKFKRMQCCQAGHPQAGLIEFDFYFASIRCFLRYVSGNLKYSIVKWLKVQFDFSQLEDAFDLVNLFKSLLELRCWFSSSEDFTFDPLAPGVEAAKKQRFVVSLDHVKKADILMDAFGRSYAIVSKVSVLLQMPCLMSLRVEPWEAFTVGYPEKLENLITPQLSLAPLDYSKFTSLRRIYTEIATQSSHVRSISASLTERLPSLRELHLEDYLNDYRDFEARYQALDKPLNASGKAPAKIFYFGFEISSKELNSDDAQLPDSLNTLDPDDTTHASTRFIARNLHRSVDQNFCVSNVQYNAMVGELDDSVMFGLMLQKLPKINELFIDGAVADEERLLRFIDKFQVLSLELQNASLSQRFFEKLPAIGQRICWLNIETERTMSILDGDFDFVFQLPNLDSLQFEDYQVPLHFVARLLRELKKLMHIYFRNPDFIFSLSKMGACKGLFLMHESNRLSHKILSEEAPAFVDELIGRLNVDGFACPKKVMALVCHLELEEQNHRFWMRKYIYDHTHSICLSKEQMQL